MEIVMENINQHNRSKNLEKNNVASTNNTFSLRKILYIGAKKIIHALKRPVLKTLNIRREFLEEEKRNRAIQEKLERAINIKVDMLPKYGKVYTIPQPNYGRTLKKQVSTKSKPVVYNQRADISRYLRSEKDVENTLELIQKLRDLKIDRNKYEEKNTLKQETTENFKEKEIGQVAPSTEKKIVSQVTEASMNIEEKIALKVKEKKTEITTEKKSVCFQPYLKNIQKIDIYLQKHQDSQDCEMQLFLRKCIDARELCLQKMKQPLLAAMCDFNDRLKVHIKAMRQDSFGETGIEEYLEKVNSKCRILQYIYETYMEQEDVNQVLSSIRVKVNWINQKYNQKEQVQEAVPFVKQKVA